MSEQQIRILIADDHPVFRFGLRALLEAQPDMAVVGEAGTGTEAVRMSAELKPDVLLMDISMPDLDGIAAAKQITAVEPHPAILMITMFDDDIVFSAMEAGAQGYVLKGAHGEETLRAVRAVANGEAIFSPSVADRMRRYFSQSRQAEQAEPFPELTSRERDVLDLLAKGLTNGAIAERLVLSPKTIRNQTSIIMSKLQVASRNEAIVKARQAGMGKTGLS